MTITVNAAGGKSALDTANPQQLADALRAMNFGHFVRAMPTPRRGVAPLAAGVYPYVAATAGVLVLPDDAKASSLFRVYARAGTSAAGPLTVDNPDTLAANAAPATLHVNVSPTGDIIFLGTDAWTAVDLIYLPEKYEVNELIFPVQANAVTLPVATQGEALFLLEVEGLQPTDTKVIVDPPGTAVATGHAALNLAKTVVNFAAGNAFTSARIKWASAAAVDIDAFLTNATANAFL